MADRVLITGGAGFIGRHVARALLEGGHDVVVLDSLVEQVHANQKDDAAACLNAEVELVFGDVRDENAVRRALVGVDSVIHLAAEVGVGQSMYQIERYVSANDVGTAVLFQEIAQRHIRRIVVASSMSIYGEGLYRQVDGTIRDHVERTAGPGIWDPVDESGHALIPLPTPETKHASLASVYALTKFTQERLTLIMARAYGIEACALRLFNVYGPGQALSNPYTGVLAIFASRLLNGRRPTVFEDGLQRRDFVHVDDVAEAFLAALNEPGAAGGVFNIASGTNTTVLDVARLLADAMGRPHIEPELIGKMRSGDIRHCFADITLARDRLGFEPRWRLEHGLQALTEWLCTQTSVDRVSQARAELEARGLVT